MSGNATWRPTLRLLLVPYLLVLLICIGCVRKSSTDVNAYRLDQVTNYAVLAPTQALDVKNSDFQTVTINLNATQPSSDIDRCIVDEPPFLLKPGPSGSRFWLMTSPSVEGWELHAGEYNLKTQWSRFISKLSTLQQLGCFGSGIDTATITRTIVERIPFPVSESLLFYYSFTGGGFVDLKSGMQLRVEKSLVEVHDGIRKIDSLEARYEVVSSPSGKFTLRLSETKNRNLAKKLGDAGALIFGLPSVIRGKPKLRLFLFSEDVSNGGTKRPSILLAASDNIQMDEASRKVETAGVESCATFSHQDVSCTIFKDVGVSLLISCRINGKKEYKALGTTVSQVINDDKKVFKTLTVKRETTKGHYAKVNFPPTMEAVRQIILLDGDQLSW